MREHEVSVSGLVPSILETLQEQDDLLSDGFFTFFHLFGFGKFAKGLKIACFSCFRVVSEPFLSVCFRKQELPALRVVFTWGEELRTRTAAAWAKKVHLIDLLIASAPWP